MNWSINDLTSLSVPVYWIAVVRCNFFASDPPRTSRQCGDTHHLIIMSDAMTWWLTWVTWWVLPWLSSHHRRVESESQQTHTLKLYSLLYHIIKKRRTIYPTSRLVSEAMALSHFALNIARFHPSLGPQSLSIMPGTGWQAVCLFLMRCFIKG